jgi:hypothetical protein
MDAKERAEQAIAAVCRRLVALVDDRVFRFRGTRRSEAMAWLESLRRFEGAKPAAIARREAAIDGEFSAIFRAYLAAMGVHSGELFLGSDVGLRNHGRFRTLATQLLVAEDPGLVLPTRAEVFLVHQGYSFSYVLAEGGFDGPVFRYDQGRGPPARECDTFLEHLHSELAVMEAARRDFRERGGYFVTIEDGVVTQEYPALDEGICPLAGPDDFTD